MADDKIGRAHWAGTGQIVILGRTQKLQQRHQVDNLWRPLKHMMAGCAGEEEVMKSTLYLGQYLCWCSSTPEGQTQRPTYCYANAESFH